MSAAQGRESAAETGRLGWAAAQEKGRGEEVMGRPGIGLAGRIRGKSEGGKRIYFPFSDLNFQITFPNDFQILSNIYQNHSSQ
jgi:hypothetical protein